MDEYDTDNSQLDDEDRDWIRRMRGFNEALDDLKHNVEKTWVGTKESTRGGGRRKQRFSPKIRFRVHYKHIWQQALDSCEAFHVGSHHYDPRAVPRWLQSGVEALRTIILGGQNANRRGLKS